MIKFDHSADTLQKSLGISDERADILSATYFFESINKNFLVKELFDNPDEAPSNLTTKTGVLEAVFEDCETEEERLYVTWDGARHESYLKTNPKYETAFLHMVTLTYALAEKDREKFIEIYKKFKRKAQDNINSDEEE